MELKRKKMTIQARRVVKIVTRKIALMKREAIAMDMVLRETTMMNMEMKILKKIMRIRIRVGMTARKMM
jgi:hypothetical protein